MYRNYLKANLLLLLFVVFIFSCGNNSTDNNNDNGTSDNESTENTIKEEPVNAICVWNSLSLKKEPITKAKNNYITGISLGEVVTTKGETVTDSSTSKARDYLKVTLGDGTKGWVQKNLMAVDAKAYVVKTTTKLYKRPDILTATKKELDRLQFLVVLEEQGDWVKIKTKRRQDKWFSEGWVKSSNLIDGTTDVAVAVLAEKALAVSDKSKKIEALSEIVNNSDLLSSEFISDINDLISELTSESNEEVIETEEETYD